jgi:hypothetical protein
MILPQIASSSAAAYTELAGHSGKPIRARIPCQDRPACLQQGGSVLLRRDGRRLGSARLQLSVAPIPGTALPETAPSAGHAAGPANTEAVPLVPTKPAPATPILPELRSLLLPSPAALPAPALKPAALPPARPAPAPVESTDRPEAAATAKPLPPPDMPSSGLASRDRAAEAARSAENPDAAVTAPIPLLPPADADAMEVEKAAVPVRPGPGSGGLY